MSDDAPDICVGILITASFIHMVVSEKAVVGKSFVLKPYDGCKYDKYIPKSAGDFETILSLLAVYIFHLPAFNRLRSIGVGSYGPLLSVDLHKRDSDDLHVDDASLAPDVDGTELPPSTYGKVSNKSPHANLRNLEIYRILRDTLDTAIDNFAVKDLLGETDNKSTKPIEIVVQTDVACGALSEAYFRYDKTQENHALQKDVGSASRFLNKDINMLVFLNVAESIGGSFVKDKNLPFGVHHPEMGFVSAQPLEKDVWAKNLVEKNSNNTTPYPTYIHRMVSTNALKERSGNVDSLEEVTPEVWDISADYIAQLCATITLILAPHKIIVNGDVNIYAKDKDGRPANFAALVNEKFKPWLETDEGQLVSFPPHMKGEYIEKSNDNIEWLDSDGKETIIDPMLHGALVLAALNSDGEQDD